MGFGTFFLCLLTFYLAIGGYIISSIKRGEWSKPDHNNPNKKAGPQPGDLRSQFREDPLEGMVIIGLCFFAWPLILKVIINE